MQEKPDKSIREALSRDAQQLFDDIDTQRVLGASRHIRMITAMLEDLMERAKAQSLTAGETRRNLLALADYFIATRGQASQGISNAICMLVRKVKAGEATELDGLAASLKEDVLAYRDKSHDDLDRINDYALSLLRGMKTVLLFDYSSTVGMLAESSREIGNGMTYLIPESRALNGGTPYVPQCRKSGHRIHFIPDAAIYYYLRQCDGVFIGAETYYADGRAFNTVGSEMVACLCRNFGVPFYVLTTLMKIDTRAQYGFVRPQVMRDLRGIIGDDADVDYSCPELVEIPAEYITAYITEEGIYPPSAMYEASRRFVERMGLGNA
jgi:ribose 1,5-bisphosphate isomerase